MIAPVSGAAFSEAVDGDMRAGSEARLRASQSLGIAEGWATVRQVHGARVLEATGPGDQGEADGLVTRRPGLPLAVFTADCLGLVVLGRGGAGLAHCGWRGLEAGVVEGLLDLMTRLGLEPRQAYGGPAIRSCCFEVGPEVADSLGDSTSRTSWGTTSVDLAAAARHRLGSIPLSLIGGCTRHLSGSFSFRRDRTTDRMASIGWVTG